MRCRDMQGVANAAYLRRFLFSALHSVAPYCARGGVRVVSKGLRCTPGRYPFPGIRLIYAESREPTSGLEPLTLSHYELTVMGLA